MREGKGGRQRTEVGTRMRDKDEGQGRRQRREEGTEREAEEGGSNNEGGRGREEQEERLKEGWRGRRLRRG